MQSTSYKMERKILTAKRHLQLQESVPNQSCKRNADSEFDFTNSKRKKELSNTRNEMLSANTSAASINTDSSYYNCRENDDKQVNIPVFQKCTKNMASARLKELRKSLEEKRNRLTVPQNTLPKNISKNEYNLASKHTDRHKLSGNFDRSMNRPNAEINNQFQSAHNPDSVKLNRSPLINSRSKTYSLTMTTEKPAQVSINKHLESTRYLFPRTETEVLKNSSGTNYGVPSNSKSILLRKTENSHEVNYSMPLKPKLSDRFTQHNLTHSTTANVSPPFLNSDHSKHSTKVMPRFSHGNLNRQNYMTSTNMTNSMPMTLTNSHNNNNDMGDVEEMDWETIPEEVVMSNIQETRKFVVTCNYNVSSYEKLFASTETISNKRAALYIVIDTNVFISHLKFVKELLDTQFHEYGQPFIIIPWMVLQELDCIKNNNDQCRTKTGLSIKARSAVNFLYEHLSARHPRIKGQSFLESNEEFMKEECPDDKILNCCLYFSKSDNIVVLLTNDKNLRNKALVNNVPAYGRDEILDKLKSEMYCSKVEKPSPVSKKRLVESRLNIDRAATRVVESGLNIHSAVTSIENLLIRDLSVVLRNEMKNAYKEIWSKVIFIKPPWTVTDILKCFKKYWMSVFSLVFPKEMLQTIDNLLAAFENYKSGLRKPDLDSIVQCTLALCLRLKRISEEYNKMFTKCINDLKTLNLQ